MNRINLQEEIVKIISKIANCTCADFNEICNVSLSNDLQFDSLKFVELIVEIESKFNIEFADDELDLLMLDDIKNIETLVKERMVN